MVMVIVVVVVIVVRVDTDVVITRSSAVVYDDWAISGVVFDNFICHDNFTVVLFMRVVPIDGVLLAGRSVPVQAVGSVG